MRTIMALTACIGLISLSACGGETSNEANADADTAYQETLMAALLDARPGDVIEIPAGVFAIERGLSLTVDNVTIRGQGADETILSFANQRQGAEGLLVSGADDFTLENLAIEDTIGDAVKITDGDNITIRGVRVEWTNGPSTENGAYGLYPVQTTDVLIEDSIAIAASDAGIYVGQSDRIIVRNNIAEYNVAGIEIENSNHADVYGNTARHNTGGILVFNMPNLPRPGAGTRVYDNVITQNNTGNFGHEGTPVASVPAGTGILINSNDDVEIFDNDLRDNRTANIIISSLYSAGFSELSVTDDFDAYPEGIYIHDNRYEGGGNNPDGTDLQAMKLATVGPLNNLPNVIWDGYTDPDKRVDGEMPDALRICAPGQDGLDIDGPNDNANMRTITLDCTLDRLEPVELDL